MFFLIISGMVASGYLAQQHYLIANDLKIDPSFCAISEKFDCDVVNASPYSELGGISIAAIGIGAYFIMLLLLIFYMLKKNNKFLLNLIYLLSILSVLVDLFLGIISGLLISSFCLVCIFTYLINILLFLSVFLFNKKQLIPPLSDFIKELFSLLSFKNREETSFAMALFFLCTFSFLFIINIPALYSNEILRESRDELFAYEISKLNSQERADFDPDDNFVDGSKLSKVKIIEFSDFECPFCQKTSNILKLALAGSEEAAGIYYYSFPLDKKCNPQIKGDFHQHACLAASAYYCAKERGKQKEMYYKIFGKQKELGPQMIYDLAEDLGFDKAEFEACLKADKTLERIRKDIELGVKLNVTSTPTILINGKKFPSNRRLTPSLIKKLINVVD